MPILSAALTLVSLVAPRPTAPMPHEVRGWVVRHTLTHKAPVTAVAATAGAYATGDKDGIVVLWDARTGLRRATLLDGTDGFGPVDYLRPTRDGKRLNILPADRISGWQLVLDAPQVRFHVTGHSVLDIDPDDNWLTVCDAERKGLCVCTFVLADGTIRGLVSGTSSHPEQMARAAAGAGLVVTVDPAGVVRTWRVRAGQAHKLLWAGARTGSAPTAVAVSPDGTMVVLVDAAGKADVLDTRNGRPLARLTSPAGAVRAVAFAPDSGLIATGGEDGTVRLWNPWTGEQEAALTGHTGPVNAVRFGSDEVLVSGGDDKTARVWTYLP